MHKAPALALFAFVSIVALPAAAGPAPFVEGTVCSLSMAEPNHSSEVVADLDREFLRSALGRDSLVVHSLPFPGGARLDVSLTAFSPLGPGFRLVEMTDAGPIEHQPPGNRRYFRGTASTSQRSLAFFVIGPDTFEGFVLVEGRLAVYGIKSDGSGKQLLAASLFSPKEPHPLCVADTPADQPWRPDPPPPWKLPAVESSTPLTAQIAIEMDYECFVKFGSVSAAGAYATGLLGAVSAIYQTDENTSLQAANIRVWSTSADPYSSGTDATTLLSELKAEYTANMGSVQRASAHLLAQRNNMGGIAYLDVLCNNNYAYGVDGIQGTYTYPSSAYTWDANCFAHELGHNFKSSHTHCYGSNVGLPDWIDKCYASESGCYGGTVVDPPMAEKTLMSYCHLLSPYQVSMTFVDKYAYTSALIRQGAEAAACLNSGGCSVSCTASVPATGSSGVAVSFVATATPSGCTGSPTYAWIFGDGGTSVQQNPSHTYASAGTYAWSMTATVQGISCTKMGSITISAGCSLACTAAAPATGTAGVALSFDATATPSGCTGSPTYSWSFGDGGTSVQQNPSYTYASAGTFNWSMTATVQGVSCSKTGSITISAACSLACTAAAPATGTAGVALSFDATATPSGCTGSPTYSWSFGDGGTSVQQSPSHTYASAGTFNWSMTAAVQGVSCAKTGSITISPECSLTCSATVAVTGTAGVEVSFAATATPSACTGSPTYSWSFGDGAASTQQNTGHVYASAGAYAWSMTASVQGVSCTKTGSISILNPPVINLVKKVSPPFKIVVRGSNLQNGIKVYINGVQWNSVVWKNTGKIQLKGGAALKAVVPKGVPATFRFVNPDGAEATTTWGW